MALLRLQWGPWNSCEEALQIGSFWISAAHALIRDEVMVFYRPLLFFQFNVLLSWITSNEQEEDCLLIRAVNAASSSGLQWLLSGPKGGGAESPKLVISILEMKTILPFRPNDLSYNFLMIPSLRCTVSVYIIGMFLNTLKQHPTKATRIACAREQSRWNGSWLDY